MRNVAIAFAIIVLAFSAVVAGSAFSSPEHDLLAIGTFLILALTLITLVWYAYDTNSIARVTRDRWKREGVLNTTYSLLLTGAKGEPGRTLFQLINGSTLVVTARVMCNFRVYGEPIDWGPEYSGLHDWILFPQQMSQGWFEIDSLVQKKGKTVAAMIAECTAANSTDQLTMDLELEFTDELGEYRKLPRRRHYFDFDRWAWIPYLTRPRA